MTTSIPPMCIVCTRLGDNFSCQAFPNGIPDEILFDFYDHRNGFLGDGGLRFVSDGSEAAAVILMAYDQPGGIQVPEFD